jgi:trehalose 6-phosphate phosphatase
MRPPPLDELAALFIDFDGTLVEIAPRPELVRVPTALPPLLARLAAQRDGALALVSGRRIAEIDRLLVPWRGAAAGLHGAERRRADGSAAVAARSPTDRAASAALDRLRPQLQALAARLPGVWLEDKNRTLALHYRAVPDRGAEIVDLVAELHRAGGDGLRLIAGKRVVELQPRGRGKDGAIAAFMAEAPFAGRRPVFLGDDATDEDAFAEIERRGGLSVFVGEPNAATAASCRLPSVAAVHRWLAAALPAQ